MEARTRQHRLDRAPWGSGDGEAHLEHNVAQLLLHFLLSALVALPQVVAYAASLKHKNARALGTAQLHNAVDVRYGAAHEGGTQHTVGDLGVQVEERQVYIALQVVAEPLCEIDTARWCGESLSSASEPLGRASAVAGGGTIPSLLFRYTLAKVTSAPTRTTTYARGSRSPRQSMSNISAAQEEMTSKGWSGRREPPVA